MLYLSEDDGEVMPSKSTACEHEKCGKPASWRMQVAGKESRANMCSWHVMYGGSQWGVDNQAEIADVGLLVRGTAIDRRGAPGVHVPTLDGLGRLSQKDADKFMLGVGFTSRMLKNGMNRRRGVDGP